VGKDTFFRIERVILVDENQIAIVTGAATGIGFGIAKRLSREGFSVMMIGRSDSIFSAAREIERSVPYKCDIRDAAEVETTVRDIYEKFGRIDALINNAGVSRLSLLTDTDDETLDLQIDTNLKGTFHMLRSVTPIMQKAGYGRIVNMSSVTGVIECDKGYSAYGMTKAGVIGLTRAASSELAEYGITCNAICPGFIRTPNVERSARKTCPDDPESVLRGISDGVPMKRLGTPDEIGALAAFLVSPDAGYITGTGIVIDGGNRIPETSVMGSTL